MDNINVPGDTIAISSGNHNPTPDDINIAMCDAFAATSRRIKEYSARKTGHRR